ncbi:NUDIX domain-containing protein [Corynebacterium kroppenstedtii]|uniref:NUDIX hydrolase n=1 Tax=Corynebacterium sp. PCR 32 TaxID=3351342 RepID=UPI0030A5438F
MSKKYSSHTRSAELAKGPRSESGERGKDADHHLSVHGDVQEVPRYPAHELGKITLAAGAVVWRHRGGVVPNSDATPSGTISRDDIEVLLIHRPRYDDWSLAKGKLDPGETLPMTAVREVKEETGYDVTLGKLLGRVSYPVKGRTKVVYYWTAECVDGSFEDNEEVDDVVWLPLHEAMALTTYDVDAQILEQAVQPSILSTTSRVILVRHAHAHPREGWGGHDDLRPLDRKGRRQASMVPGELAGFGVTALYSADLVRCRATVEPLSRETGLRIEVDDVLSDDGWATRRDEAKDHIRRIVAQGGVSVVASQGRAIPGIIAWLSAEGVLGCAEIPCKKSSAWVLSFTDGRFTGADYLASPLPIK